MQQAPQGTGSLSNSISSHDRVLGEKAQLFPLRFGCGSHSNAFAMPPPHLLLPKTRSAFRAFESFVGSVPRTVRSNRRTPLMKVLQDTFSN